MKEPIKRDTILYVDDEEGNLVAFELNFGDEFRVLTASSGAEALDTLAREEVAVLVVDQRMPGMTGLEVLAKAKELRPGHIGVLLTAYRDIEVLVEALNSGLVYRYIHKPWDRREMEVILRQLVELHRVREENIALQRRLEELNKYLGHEVSRQHNFGEIVGCSDGLARVLETIKKVAPTRSTVLITGESGTGKELVARAIHNASPRAKKPFVRVNLAALSPTIIESELFGHEKGAFTGAYTQKLGRFELAHEGSIFLDEIGDLPLETQIKLLRVLQEREFERVGGSSTISVDVRVIVATNTNLAERVKEGSFREDLYYRINVFPISIPPLRERPSDIPLLARHFLRKFEAGVGKRFTGIAPDAEKLLLKYSWPGNVRELENVIERAMILSPGPELTAEDLEFLRVDVEAGVGVGLDKMLDTLERQRLAEALGRHGGSVTKVARELGLNRTTAYYRLKKYGLA